MLLNLDNRYNYNTLIYSLCKILVGQLINRKITIIWNFLKNLLKITGHFMPIRFRVFYLQKSTRFHPEHVIPLKEILQNTKNTIYFFCIGSIFHSHYLLPGQFQEHLMITMSKSVNYLRRLSYRLNNFIFDNTALILI